MNKVHKHHPTSVTTSSHSTCVEFVASSNLPTKYGIFTLHGFQDTANKQEHLALTIGDLNDAPSVLTRIHSECLTGDALFSLRCDCGAQLQIAMNKIAKEKRGIIIYQRQEGRGIGLLNKIKAYHLQDQGADTVEANKKLGFDPDLRHYDACIHILKYFGIKKIRLLTNNPKKIDAIGNDQGIEIVERVSLISEHNYYNQRYLKTKVHKLGHMLP